MNYGEFVNTLKKLACVVSTKKNDDGSFGVPCIEAANDLYLESVNVERKDFVPGRPYYDYIVCDNNFEMLNYRCITENRLIHTYVNAERYEGWMDIHMMPLNSDREDMFYAVFSYEISPKADADKISDVSAQTAMQVIKTSVKLRETDDFEKAMQSVIEDIRACCRAKKCCIMLTDFKTRTCSVLAHSISKSDKGKKLEDFVDRDLFEMVEEWDKLIAGSNCYLIQDDHDIENIKDKSPLWYESLINANVKTLVLYPLRINDETVGYIWATNFDVEETLNIKQVLEVTTFLLASEIHNHQLYKRMENLSVTDLLTGLYNRNAMNNKVVDIVNGNSPFEHDYGVVFVDMNGLKTVNDNEGHVAGDKLLRNVALFLKETFKDQEIYRVGGDEFLIVVENKTEEEFFKLVDTLKQKSEESDTYKVAVGACYQDAKYDIRKAMHLADEIMYKDKEKFYIKHPEFERRENRQ